MTDSGTNEPDEAAKQGRWKTLALILLGVLLGAALVLAFLAYSQPALLLEQFNLRYCG